VTGFSTPTFRPSALRVLFSVLVALALIGIWAGGTSGATSSKASAKHTCQVVAATLSDGPDPDADPVGYALAQVLPLRQITTSDEPLKKSIDRLSSAYETFYKDNGTKAAKKIVATAAKSLNTYCPGAVS
jgi:hypothetical protein